MQEQSRRGGRPSAKGQFIDQVREMYLEQKMSLQEISAQVGKSAGTLSAWLKSEGIELEPRPRNPNAGRSPEQQAEINARIKESIVRSPARKERPGGRPREIEREERSCPVDQTVFVVRVTDDQEFCSLSCARVGQGKKYTARKEREWLDSSESDCACGNKIAYADRGNQYCSTLCAKEHGNWRKPDPTNYRTRTCLNETCGKKFTRYRTYGKGDTKYCSVACSMRHTKTRRFYAVEDFDIVFESSYEAFFWSACKIAGIPIERFDRQYGVQWDSERPDAWYAPDFWLPAQQVAVEVKGVVDDDDEERWAAYRVQSGGRLIILTQVELRQAVEHMETMVQLLSAVRTLGPA